MKKTFIVGITGNFATGKTQFCKFIEEQGFPVIYSDFIAKKVIMVNNYAINAIRKEFGERAFLSDGTFNAKYISSIVFANTPQAKEKLLKLNSIIHPIVIDEILVEIENLIERGHNLIFVESALIYEVGLEKAFDMIILVTSKKEAIYEKAIQNYNLTKKEIKARLDAQIDDKEKESLADFVVYNNSSLEDLRQNAYFILEIINGLLKNEKQIKK
ncbi:MAG: dephospho-CoA kinase [Candidatus Kapaibacteriales bacterium]